MGRLIGGGERERDLRQRDGDQRPFLESLVSAPGELERHDQHGRNRRTAKENRQHGRGVTIGQLCAAVAYHYKLTPQQVAQFSCQQLLTWYETAVAEVGHEKNLELEISLVPHTENPERTLRDLREALSKMTSLP